MQYQFQSPFLCKKASYRLERCTVDGGAETKSYKQYLEIEIARRRNGRIDRPGARFSKLPVIIGPVKLFCFPFQVGVSKVLKIIH